MTAKTPARANYAMPDELRKPMQLRDLPESVYQEILRATEEKRPGQWSVNSQILVILDDWATARIQARFDAMPFPDAAAR